MILLVTHGRVLTLLTLNHQARKDKQDEVYFPLNRVYQSNITGASSANSLSLCWNHRPSIANPHTAAVGKRESLCPVIETQNPPARLNVFKTPSDGLLAVAKPRR